MIKESIIPKDAIKWIFELSPLISVTVSILFLFIFPLLENLFWELRRSDFSNLSVYISGLGFGSIFFQFFLF
ncbi:NADH-quinone oxidoreductase subunit H [bacterium]|nr:NADH-quinone oxidoreductase subunit H [bacterium]